MLNSFAWHHASIGKLAFGLDDLRKFAKGAGTNWPVLKILLEKAAFGKISALEILDAKARNAANLTRIPG